MVQTQLDPLGAKYPVVLQLRQVLLEEQPTQPGMVALHSVHFPLNRW